MIPSAWKEFFQQKDSVILCAVILIRGLLFDWDWLQVVILLAEINLAVFYLRNGRKGHGIFFIVMAAFSVIGIIRSFFFAG